MTAEEIKRQPLTQTKRKQKHADDQDSLCLRSWRKLKLLNTLWIELKKFSLIFQENAYESFFMAALPFIAQYEFQGHKAPALMYSDRPTFSTGIFVAPAHCGSVVPRGLKSRRSD